MPKKHVYGTISENMTHGIYSTYAKGCKCPDCKEAMRIYNMHRRHPERVGELTHDDVIDVLIEELQRGIT